MNLQAELSGHPWAMHRETFESLIRSTTAAGPSVRPVPGLGKKRVEGGIAVIDITGVITPRASFLNMLLGGTDVPSIQRELNDAMADSSISKIVLNIDSPGGAVTGISELADQVYKARSVKPIEAFVPGMAASAAYWIASATSRITIADTVSVGSIGVVGTVIDDRVRQGMQGITFHEIVSSNAPRKRPDPLTPEGRSVLQSGIDSIASVFTAKVAHYRGVSEKTVNADFGQGGIVIGAAAVRAGLADAIGNFETLLVAPGATTIPRGPQLRLRKMILAKPGGSVTRIFAPSSEASKSTRHTPRPTTRAASGCLVARMGGPIGAGRLPKLHLVQLAGERQAQLHPTTRRNAKRNGIAIRTYALNLGASKSSPPIPGQIMPGGSGSMLAR